MYPLRASYFNILSRRSVAERAAGSLLVIAIVPGRVEIDEESYDVGNSKKLMCGWV